MARQTFASNDDYSIEWEIIGEHCHVHCLVHTWKKSVLRQGYQEVVKLKAHVRELGYDQMVSISPNPRFCKLLGATSLGLFKEGLEVMVWETAPI
jgi:hypothetical protein